MFEESICAKVRSFIARRSPRQVGDHEPLIESGVVDSMGILELVTFIEREFGVQLSDEDVSPENFRSIHSVAGFLTGRLRA
jgi:acyl carrier protein